MPNLHAVAATTVAVPNLTETVIATMTAFDERYSQGGPDFGQGGQSTVGAQGVFLGGSINVTPSSAGLITIRVRQQSVTGPLVGVAQVVSVTAVQTALDIGELDPTLIQLPAIYVVTMSVATGTAVVNRVVFTAEGATAFE